MRNTRSRHVIKCTNPLKDEIKQTLLNIKLTVNKKNTHIEVQKYKKERRMKITGFRLSTPLRGSNKNELSWPEPEVADFISSDSGHL